MWGYLAANVGMSKQAGGDRVSTISLLDCSTSVALATSPTEEEEEEEEEVPTFTLTPAAACSGIPKGGSNTPPRNSEGPPKLCETQPNCENC